MISAKISWFGLYDIVFKSVIPSFIYDVASGDDIITPCINLINHYWFTYLVTLCNDVHTNVEICRQVTFFFFFKQEYALGTYWIFLMIEFHNLSLSVDTGK